MWNVVLRDHFPALRLLVKPVRVSDQPQGKRLGALRTVEGNESDNVTQVIACERRPISL